MTRYVGITVSKQLNVSDVVTNHALYYSPACMCTYNEIRSPFCVSPFECLSAIPDHATYLNAYMRLPLLID